MISLKLLEKHGCSPESLRTIFSKPENQGPTFAQTVVGSAEPPADGKKKKKTDTSENLVNKLRNRIRTRMQQGRDWNLSTYKPFYAIDRAMDVPLEKAVTPTMLATLVNRQWNSCKEVGESLSAWGYSLDDVIMEVPDAKVDGKSAVKVSVPAFYQIVPPLVLAYKTIRQAKIMNDLNQTPYYEYHPAYESAKSRLQCDVLTNRVERMSSDYGYYNVDDQAVSNMLTYGRGFKFPREEWHSETQEVEDAEQAEKTAEGEPVKNKGENYTRIVKEGIRFDVPHPSRVYWDQAYAPHTLNTDTGCSYSGYWHVVRASEVLDNPEYFNKEKISVGGYNWLTPGWNAFFSTIYPCTIQFPSLSGNQNDRETALVDQYYTGTEGDRALVVTNHFEKLVPKDFGLGDYKYPVWFRFVVAGDDSIIYAAPLPYAPTTAYLYDHDQNKKNVASMALEVIPWQDHFGMLLSQTILTIKSNLTNVTFVDSDLVKEADMKRIENLGENKFRKRNFIRVSGKKNFAAQQGVATGFYSHQFPQLDANGTMQGMRLLLDTLERVLQMSSQELGQAASHEQTAKETGIIAQQTSTRLLYTATPVIQAREATKKQLYYGIMAYGEDSFWAQIPNDRSITPEFLLEIGFETTELHPVFAHNRRMTVRVKKSALLLESFAAVRTNEADRQRDTQIGQALIGMLDELMKGPMGPGIGVEQGLELITMAGRMVGWPRDFRLKNMSPQQTPEQQAEQVKQQLSGYIQEIEGTIMAQVKQAIVPMLQHQKALEEAVAHLTAIGGHVNPQLEAPQPQPMPMPAVQPPAAGVGQV